MLESGLGLVARKFGHRFLGAVIINQRFAGGSCGDEGSRGGVVERPRQAQARLVEAGNGVICKLSRAQDYAEQPVPLQFARVSHTR